MGKITHRNPFLFPSPTLRYFCTDFRFQLQKNEVNTPVKKNELDLITLKYSLSPSFSFFFFFYNTQPLFSRWDVPWQRNTRRPSCPCIYRIYKTSLSKKIGFLKILLCEVNLLFEVQTVILRKVKEKALHVLSTENSYCPAAAGQHKEREAKAEV